MIKFLYANGDSYGFGQELDGPRTSDKFYLLSEFQRNHCYSGVIANRLGLQYQNESLPGGSNQRIYRTTLQTVSKLLTYYNPNEIFVMLSLTYNHRREFYCIDTKKYYAHMPTWRPTFNCAPITQLWELLTKSFHDNIGDHDFDQQMILGLQNFLRVNKVPYLMTWSMHHGADFDLEKNYVDKNLLNQRYEKRFFQDPSFNAYVSKLNLPKGPGKHPLTEGHLAWAELLLDYIKQNNLLEDIDLYDKR